MFVDTNFSTQFAWINQYCCFSHTAEVKYLLQLGIQGKMTFILTGVNSNIILDILVPFLQLCQYGTCILCSHKYHYIYHKMHVLNVIIPSIIIVQQVVPIIIDSLSTLIFDSHHRHQKLYRKTFITGKWQVLCHLIQLMISTFTMLN